MKAQNTFTLIISRNFGHPISFSVAVWRVYLGGAILALFLGAVLVMSVLFMATYPRMLDAERERDRVIEERDQLRDQILSARQRWLELKEAALARKPVDDTEEARRARLSEGVSASEYLPPLQITSVKTYVNGRTVEVVFRIVNQGDSQRNRGGFLFAIFENLETDPVQYVASPRVGLSDDGFPETYKAGIRFSRVRDAVTYRRKIRRQSPDEYFTHVNLYLFSLRGGLLAKDRFELDREIFLTAGLPRHAAGRSGG